jgi:manganese/zinc/iron transport system permease protein
MIVLVGASLLGASSGLVGAFAVLRRRALAGDALAHAALPGLCLAFLVLGERNLSAMLFGAFLTGLLGIAIVSGLRHATRIKEDAAIGIVLSVFYGAGIALSSFIQNQTNVGSKAGLHTYILGKTAGMILADVYLIAAASLFCLLLIILLYKEFKVVAFDSAFASVQGWPSVLIDLLLMAMIAVTVVIGLPAVGVVMMAALLIIPAASARFWTDRLGPMLGLSSFFGLTIGAVGTLMSARFSQLPAGPVIVMAGAIVFLVSLLAAPRRGIVARQLSVRRDRRQLALRATCRALYELVEAELPQVRPLEFDEILRHKSWQRQELAACLQQLEKEGVVSQTTNGTFLLTEQGRKRAAETVRLRRLSELYQHQYGSFAGTLDELDGGAFIEELPHELVATLEDELRSSGRFPAAGSV